MSWWFRKSLTEYQHHHEGRWEYDHSWERFFRGFDTNLSCNRILTNERSIFSYHLEYMGKCVFKKIFWLTLERGYNQRLSTNNLCIHQILHWISLEERYFSLPWCSMLAGLCCLSWAPLLSNLSPIFWVKGIIESTRPFQSMRFSFPWLRI